MSTDRFMGLSFANADGGPMIIVPHSALPSWRGIDPPPPETPAISVSRRITRSGPATDYDRACNAEGIVASLTLDTGEALVLGNYVDNAGWLPARSGRRGGAIVRVVAVLDEGELEANILRILDTEFPPSDVEWVVTERHSWLFSAADRGWEAERSGIEIVLEPGQYEVRTIHFDDPSVGEAMVHCLLSKTSSPTVRQAPLMQVSPTERKRVRTKREVLTPGDILEIELGGMYAYVAYVGPHFVFNDAIWVVPRAFDTPVVDYCSLFDHGGYMIFYLARQALSRQQVRRVGHCANAIRAVPKTLRFMSKTDPDGTVSLWNISGDGVRNLLVATLSEEQVAIPIAENWSHEKLVSRIIEEWTPERYNRR